MSRMNLSIVAGVVLGAVFTSAGGEPPERLFAALAMTKEQEASPLPTDSGVFLRDAEADEWERIGPVIQSMNSLEVDPQDLDTMFIACGNGIVRSVDGGETWRLTSGWRESDVLTVAVDPKDGSHVYAASIWGVSISRDGGETWDPSNDGLAETYCRTVVVDQRRPRRLLLGTADGVYESVNRGRSWRPIRSSPKLVILRLARSRTDHRIWMAGTEGKGLYLSNNDGRTWAPAARQLADANLYAVAADPADSRRMATGGWGTGPWISRDGGEQWQRASDALPSENITAMAFDANVAGRLWVSTFEEGTYFTDDFGKTWQSGDLDGAYVFDLGFVPVSD